MLNLCDLMSNKFSALSLFIFGHILCLLADKVVGLNYEIESDFGDIKKIGKNITSVSLKANVDYSKLRYLYFDENNLQIDDIKRLSKLENVEALNVSDNNISGIFDLSLLSIMRKLKVFWAFSNHITEFRNSVHREQLSAKIFDFSANKLKYVDLKVFDGFQHLEFLNLERNMISKLDGSAEVRKIFPKILQITMEENEWSCKSLQRILDDFKRESIRGHMFEENSCNDHKNYLLEHICCNNVTLH